ncbi:malonate decarboxylase holo-[acyl-carrier-protein] synthase [uncultured Phascolarctobacterium sp.]|uniref:malonate decarboxylase holo-[acyl-carrier-protein] synthase n=1 Tax=uncultured Phascolarctobacterium sp. TaxID=512296 RepID=UPI002633FBB0|nr:malonate decarboxylase holo-[acyl-carrier-protein] synthase [uncultured Phascolarctobacterium sp.]
MDKTQLNRHDLVFISQTGKDKIWKELSDKYQGEELSMVRDVFLGDNDIPGFVRRSDERPEEVALGFVHPQRIKGNRIRIAAFTGAEDVEIIMTPYEVLQRKVFTVKGATRCIETIIALYALADEFDLQIGVLGSAALELATGLPYTDEASDVDILLKPAPYNRLLDFYRTAKENFSDIPLDFELDLPNGYGVKLAEVFMDTKTLLGKSLDNVSILYRKDIMQYLL